jgi:hypothetical protein
LKQNPDQRNAAQDWNIKFVLKQSLLTGKPCYNCYCQELQVLMAMTGDYLLQRFDAM